MVLGLEIFFALILLCLITVNGFIVQHILRLLTRCAQSLKGGKKTIKKDTQPFKPFSFLMGLIEGAVSSGMTIYLASYTSSDASDINPVFLVATMIGGWIAIKSINHSSEDETIGQEKQNTGLSSTELRYKFVIGTLLNIGLGVVSGFVVLFLYSRLS